MVTYEVQADHQSDETDPVPHSGYNVDVGVVARRLNSRFNCPRTRSGNIHQPPIDQWGKVARLQPCNNNNNNNNNKKNRFIKKIQIYKKSVQPCRLSPIHKLQVGS